MDSQCYKILWNKMMSVELFNKNIRDKEINGNIGIRLINCIFKHGGTQDGNMMYDVYYDKKINEKTNEKNNDKIKDENNNDTEYCNSTTNNFCDIIDE